MTGSVIDAVAWFLARRDRAELRRRLADRPSYPFAARPQATDFAERVRELLRERAELTTGIRAQLDVIAAGAGRLGEIADELSALHAIAVDGPGVGGVQACTLTGAAWVGSDGDPAGDPGDGAGEGARE